MFIFHTHKNEPLQGNLTIIAQIKFFIEAKGK